MTRASFFFLAMAVFLFGSLSSILILMLILGRHSWSLSSMQSSFFFWFSSHCLGSSHCQSSSFLWILLLPLFFLSLDSLTATLLPFFGSSDCQSSSFLWILFLPVFFLGFSYCQSSSLDSLTASLLPWILLLPVFFRFLDPMYYNYCQCDDRVQKSSIYKFLSITTVTSPKLKP